jgi:HAD superfamily hydrolase (TIGR01549 family)
MEAVCVLTARSQTCSANACAADVGRAYQGAFTLQTESSHKSLLYKTNDVPEPHIGCGECILCHPSSQEEAALTLLLDLDDTLLDNSMDTFLPAYFQAIGKHLSHIVPPDKLLPLLLSATREMVENNRSDHSLKQVFDQAFYPALAAQPEEVQESIDSFYSNVFPTLRSLTQPRPEAVALIREAVKRKYRLVLATSPLFPRTAIVQRVSWAGLSPEDFSLIPSYETNYFTKPNPAYFAELLAYLGWPEGPVVMVGDDYFNDILPAQKAGITTYWVSPEPWAVPEDSGVESANGELGGLLEWLDSISEEQLQPDLDQPDAILAILRAIPCRSGRP